MTIANSAPGTVGPAAAPLVLRELPPGPGRGRALALLSAGDGAGDEETLLGAGRLFALTDLAADPEGLPAAAAVTVTRGDEVELRRFAVHPSLPEAALVPRLLAGLADALRAAGRRHLVVAVPATDHSRLTLLTGAGFEPTARDGATADEARLGLEL